VGTSVRPKPSRRALVAIGVLLLWLVGLGFLARQELFRPRLERLAEAGLRVDQYTSFYGLRESGQLVGYASSIVDTTPTEISITEFMVRELSVRRPRWSRQARIRLTRTFRIKDFTSSVRTATVNLRTTGRVEGDSMIVSVSIGGQPPTTSVIKLHGAVLLPELVPFAVALMNEPVVGRKYTLPVFDPARQAIVDVKSTIQKETTFVVSDSSVMDSVTHVWSGIRAVPLKAWLVSSSPGGFNGWLDETGHIVRTTGLDADVLRSTIEEAFENWLIGVNERRRTAGMLPTREFVGQGPPDS
jgi:hypothetical protein